MKAEIFFKGGGTARIGVTAEEFYESTASGDLAIFPGIGNKKIVINLTHVLFVKDL